MGQKCSGPACCAADAQVNLQDLRQRHAPEHADETSAALQEEDELKHESGPEDTEGEPAAHQRRAHPGHAWPHQPSRPNVDRGALAREGEGEEPVVPPRGAGSKRFTEGGEELRDLRRHGLQLDGWQPTHRFKNGAKYTGEWSGTKRHGYGEQKWKDGSFYEGEWADDAASGRGRFVHASGASYTGEWRGSVADGMGIYHQPGFTTYCGEWKEDAQEGNGIELWEDGARYEGDFQSGEKGGYGVYHFADRSKYWGTWRCNVISGPGSYVAGRHRRLFRGQWMDSLFHGRGLYVWEHCRQYSGEYNMGLRHGFGTMLWPEERRFDGYWRAGKMHGDGIHTKGDEYECSMHYVNGVATTPLRPKRPSPAKD